MNNSQSIYKTMLNTIAEPICELEEKQIDLIIDKLILLDTPGRQVATSLTRLNNYIRLSIRLAKEQENAQQNFIDFLGNFK